MESVSDRPTCQRAGAIARTRDLRSAQSHVAMTPLDRLSASAPAGAAASRRAPTTGGSLARSRPWPLARAPPGQRVRRFESSSPWRSSNASRFSVVAASRQPSKWVAAIPLRTRSRHTPMGGSRKPVRAPLLHLRNLRKSADLSSNGIRPDEMGTGSQFAAPRHPSCISLAWSTLLLVAWAPPSVTWS